MSTCNVPTALMVSPPSSDLRGQHRLPVSAPSVVVTAALREMGGRPLGSTLVSGRAVGGHLGVYGPGRPLNPRAVVGWCSATCRAPPAHRPRATGRLAAVVGLRWRPPPWPATKPRPGARPHFKQQTVTTTDPRWRVMLFTCHRMVVFRGSTLAPAHRFPHPLVENRVVTGLDVAIADRRRDRRSVSGLSPAVAGAAMTAAWSHRSVAHRGHGSMHSCSLLGAVWWPWGARPHVSRVASWPPVAEELADGCDPRKARATSAPGDRNHDTGEVHKGTAIEGVLAASSGVVPRAGFLLISMLSTLSLYDNSDRRAAEGRSG